MYAGGGSSGGWAENLDKGWNASWAWGSDGDSAGGWAENLAKGWTDSWARGSDGGSAGGWAWDSIGGWESDVFPLLLFSVNDGVR